MSGSSTPQASAAPIGILPGQAVSSFAVAVPPLSAAKLAKALPHIMADYLADDAGDTAFCVATRTAAGQALVLACDTALLRQTIATAAQNKTNLTALWPDYMRLAVPESGTAILTVDEDIVARRADGTGFRLPKAMAEAVLAGETTHEGIETEFPADGPGFAVGRFGPNLPVGALVKKMRRTLTLGLLAVVVWSGGLLLQATQNETGRDRLEAQEIALYKQRFPEARRIVNVEAQLRGKLGNAGLGQGFASYFARVQQVLGEQQAARLEGLSYTAQPTPALKLVIATPSFAELEDVRSRLRKAGFRLSGGSSEQVDGLIINELTLTSGGRR